MSIKVSMSRAYYDSAIGQEKVADVPSNPLYEVTRHGAFIGTQYFNVFKSLAILIVQLSYLYEYEA